MKTTRRSTQATTSTRSVPVAARPAPRTPRKAPADMGQAAPPAEGSHRKLYVLGSLVGVMTLTSALLLAVRRDPLVPDTSVSLMAADSTDGVFETKVPVRPGRWKYVFVHHSRTASGNATALAEAAGSSAGPADHFVIGNGDGCGDGEIQITRRWDQQQSAGHTPGVDRMDPACISICLIGDFDRTYPTPAQVQRLNQLVGSLQTRLRIADEAVLTADVRASPAGVGRHFPRTGFRTFR